MYSGATTKSNIIQCNWKTFHQETAHRCWNSLLRQFHKKQLEFPTSATRVDLSCVGGVQHRLCLYNFFLFHFYISSHFQFIESRADVKTCSRCVDSFTDEIFWVLRFGQVKEFFTSKKVFPGGERFFAATIFLAHVLKFHIVGSFIWFIRNIFYSFDDLFTNSLGVIGREPKKEI